MFSFGGFSSIIPYIGYLMVMWVCILVGLSGQANKLFAIILHPADSNEIRIKEKNYSEQSCYLLVPIVQHNKQYVLFAEFFFNKFFNAKSISQQYIKECFKLPFDPYPDTKALRAPPCA